MSTIQTFYLRPIARARVSLRRYDGYRVDQPQAPCPSRWGYHNASVDVGDLEIEETTLVEGPLGLEVAWWVESGGRLVRRGGHSPLVTDVMKADARWPKECECGHAFGDAESWQWNVDQLYEGPDGLLVADLNAAPPGATWDGYWYRRAGSKDCQGPDGHTMIVSLLPGGSGDHWNVDGPGKGNARWTRTGTWERATASPSILTPRYHGFLREGRLESC